MRKVFLALAALAAIFALPASAIAQTRTSVTGTVIGSDGIPWTGASITATIISSGGASFSLTPCTSGAGCPVQNPTTGGVQAGGAYTMSLWADASILPAGTTYTFTATINGLAPAVGTGPQTCTVTGVTIAGATQTVNLSSCPALTNIAAASSSIYPVFNILAYGGRGDLRTCTVTTNSTVTITGAGANPCSFTSADVGRIIWVMNPSTNAAICGSKTVAESITAQVGTSATLKVACTASLTATAVAYIGTDNYTPMQKMATAITSANGGVGYAPSGNYGVGGLSHGAGNRVFYSHHRHRHRVRSKATARMIPCFTRHHGFTRPSPRMVMFLASIISRRRCSRISVSISTISSRTTTLALG